MLGYGLYLDFLMSVLNYLYSRIRCIKLQWMFNMMDEL